MAQLRGAFKQALEQPDGKSVNRENSDTGNRGRVTPLKTGKHEGRTCRLLEISNTPACGESNIARYRFCRQPDGSWKAE